MTKKWALVVGGAALVAVLLVAGQLLTPTGNGSTPGSVGTTADSTGALGSTAATTAPQGSPSDPVTTGDGSQRRVSPPSNLKPIAPTGPLAEGETLPPLSSTPPRIVSSFPVGSMPAGSSYRVVMRPWGLGAAGPLGRTVVVTVDSMTALSGAPSRTGMRGRPLLVVMGTGPGRTVARGGRYSAVLAFVVDGDRLVPELREAVPIAK